MQLKVDRYQTTGGLGVLPGTRAEAVIIRAGGSTGSLTGSLRSGSS